MENKEQQRALQIDGLNICPPIGAIYAAMGLHACVPMSHGASGCCRFQRMELAKHFNKLIRVSTTVLHEAAAVFGGEENLDIAVKNVFEAYDPEIIAIHTTCLSETIGDHLDGIVSRMEIPTGKRVIYTSTPGYHGSQLTGYASMTRSMVEQLAEQGSGTEDRLLLVPGWLNPADVEELDRYAGYVSPSRTVLPDLRGVMDEKTPRHVKQYVSGGTTLQEAERVGSCRAAVTLGREATEPVKQALLDKGVGRVLCLDLPVGLGATDDYVEALLELTGQPAPGVLKRERARAVDVLMELHPRFYHKTAALMCDADLSLPLTRFLCEIGILPKYICVGYAEPGYREAVEAVLRQYGTEGTVLVGADRFDLEERLAREPVDLLFGGTRGKQLARRFRIPLVRIGFPVCDRPLFYLEPIVGYRGCLKLMRDILEALAIQFEEGLPPEKLPYAQFF